MKEKKGTANKCLTFFVLCLLKCPNFFPVSLSLSLVALRKILI